MGILGVRICPNCGSEEVMMVAGGITGSWMCKKCGYSGSVFPEKEIVGGDLKDRKKGRIKNNNDTKGD